MIGFRDHCLRAGLWGAIALLIPGISAACSVCMTGREDETRIAFELMTAFMTAMPFVLVGGVFWWLRGRVRELEAMHEQARMVAEQNSRGSDSFSSSSTRAASPTGPTLSSQSSPMIVAEPSRR